jgi:hypothetical protein
MAQADDGNVYVGLTNRGWSSLGSSPYGLQRLEWTGKTPFEIQEMRAKPDGFELLFTQPVDASSAAEVGSYGMTSYTYLYHSTYGSDEVLKKEPKIREAVVSDDRLRVHLKVDGLRELFVHELDAHGVTNTNGRALLHRKAFYTLNDIPND